MQETGFMSLAEVDHLLKKSSEFCKATFHPSVVSEYASSISSPIPKFIAASCGIYTVATHTFASLCPDASSFPSADAGDSTTTHPRFSSALSSKSSRAASSPTCGARSLAFQPQTAPSRPSSISSLLPQSRCAPPSARTSTSAGRRSSSLVTPVGSVQLSALR
ncbi:hypothetical protein BJV78DRAFT_1263521 [Lactifluus subvellereus]|nr:hypothetical protein BJV78DRAFT_1263521 [Lactifluus subvellereus]